MTSPTHAGQVALVTGANKGIGREVCRQLAEFGMTVLAGARDARRGRTAVAELTAEGAADVRYLPLDVTDEASVRAAARSVSDEFGRLDVLVNNAGISGVNSTSHPGVGDITADDLRRTFETNLFGVIAVTQAVLPQLRTAGGRVINLSSAFGSFAKITAAAGRSTPRPHLLLPYSSAKAALNMVTVLYAQALRADGVSVNAVSPGYVATDLNNHAGTRTVSEGARVVVDLATRPAADLPTGAFLTDTGALAW